MKVFYHNEVDALYLEFSKEKPDGDSEISEGVNLDVTKKNKIVGIEILDASNKFDIRTILSYNLEFDKDVLLRKTA